MSDQISSIEKIKDQIICKKKFTCLNPDFDALCEAKDIGINQFVECKSPGFAECDFSMKFGEMYICKCPVRVYIEKNLKE